ncbi:MAG: glycosyltransferase family 2 protein [Gammaproteobacteria bacterium]|nr:glycosyltransferase family 2 protein [Gammaproteobacteria bacterium]
MMSLSIVIPAKNESASIERIVTAAKEAWPDAEIIVVDDGSSDTTAELSRSAGARLVQHPESLGNGAAIKSGARIAQGDIIAFMDGDGQHDAKELQPLLEQLENGYDMAIGARDTGSHANVGRLFANGLYNAVASVLSGRKIPDLTSGFRVVRADKFKQFLYLLPNGFSYPTTITMAFLRNGYPITFEPITASRRVGKSHIRPLRDGTRFLAIIFKIATLYSPLKIFLPIAVAFFFAGAGWYAYTFATLGRFTNMSLLLFSASVIIFLIGLISEQITALTYSKS